MDFSRATRSMVVGLACLAIVLLLTSVHAAASSGSVQRANYTGFTLTTASAFPFIFTQETSIAEGIGTAVGSPTPDNKRVDIRIKDLSGAPVAAWVYFIKPGVDDTYTTKLICSQTPKSLAINPKYAILVGPAVGQCGSDTSLPTRGTVTFRFSS